MEQSSSRNQSPSLDVSSDNLSFATNQEQTQELPKTPQHVSQIPFTSLGKLSCVVVFVIVVTFILIRLQE